MKFDPNSATPDEPSATPGGFDPSTASEVKPAGPIRRMLGDMVGTPLAQGIVGVPEAAVGIADILTGGQAGKAAERAGFRPKEAKQIIGDALYSDEQKEANRKVAEAEGFVPTLKALAENPSTIVRTAVESLPSMLAGGAVSRVGPIAGMANPVARGALGEGIVAAGGAAEQIRQESADGLLNPGQAGAALATGAANAVISRIAGGAANRMGIGDLETGMAAGKLGPVGAEGAEAAAKKGILRKVLEGVITEGALEEMPQSAVEQVLQNLALGKPWDEGVGSAAATGLAAGGFTGGAVAPLRGPSAAAAAAPATGPNWTTSPGAGTGAPTGAGGPAVEAPELETALGAAGPRDGLEFQRDVDTSGLGLVDPAEEARARAALIDFQPVDATPQWDTAPGAAGPGAGGLELPTPPIDTGRLALAPEAGPISRAAMLALPAPGTIPDIAVDAGGTAVVGGVDKPKKRERTGETAGGRGPAPSGDWKNAARPNPNAGPISRAAGLAPAPAAAPVAQDTPNTTAAAAPTGPQLQEGDFVVDEHFVGAHRAATSPLNQRKEPSQAQKDAENYPVGRTRVAGMAVSIENPQGSKRTGKAPDGTEWETLMTAHYGRLPGTIAADSTKKKKQGLDVFIKPGTPKDHKGPVFVIDQVDPETGKFDEHKLVFGATDENDALRTYRSNYDAGWNGAGAITGIPLQPFKAWAYDKKRKSKPLGDISTWRAGAPPDLGAAPAGAAAQPAAAAAGGAGPAAFDASSATLDDVAPGGPLGRFGTAIAAGGKPFATREQADQHRRKFRTDHRVEEVEAGFVLRPKTPEELEQEQAAGVRRQRASRAASYDANPFLTFLATHGLYHEKDKPRSQKVEFSPDSFVMVGGYGPVFRRDGKLPDALVQPAIEEGYLPQSADERDLEELIHKAMRGERVAPMFTEDGAQQEMERRAAAASDEQREAAEALAEVPDDTFARLEENADVFWDGPSNATTEQAMRALGFTEEEIADAIAAETQPTTAADAGAEDPARDSGVGEAAEGPAAGGDPDGAQAPDDFVEDQPQDLLGDAPRQAQQDAARELAEREEAQRRQQAAAPSSDEFVLAGSDRPADQAAARGQGDLLDASTAAGEDNPAAPAPEVAKPVESAADSSEPAAAPPSAPAMGSGEQSAASRSSQQWVNEGLTPEQQLQQRIDILANELAATVATEAKEKDFAPSDMPTTVRHWAAENKVPADDLRIALLKKLEGRVKDGRMKQIRAALDPTKAKAPAPKYKDAPPQTQLTGVQEEPPKTKPGTVTNFGEALPEARRNRNRALSDEVKDEEWLSEPFGKLWPADEHEQYDNPFISALVYAAREMVPAKPRTSWKAKAWVEKVKGLRDLGATATRMELTRERLLERMGRLRGLDQFANKVRILEALPRDQWKRIGKVGFYPEAYGYEDGKQVAKPYGYVEVDGKLWQYEGEDFDGLIRRAQSNVDTLVPAEAPKMKFEVRGPTKGKYIIVKTGDREYRPLMETTELAEARKAIKDAHAVLVASWERVKDRDNVKERDLRSEVNRPRTGKDWRQGKDVTPEQFQEAFGFRGGEFGTWVTQGAGGKERQGLLNQAYDALQDLAYLLGIQPKAISLNGTLGIAFGSRGSGWASAHFEPSNLVINLTKTRGAGALGHEWFHALDNYFARRRNDGQEVPIKAGLGDVQGDYRRANYITYKPEAMLVHKTQPRLKMTRERLRQLHEAQPGLDTYKPENWMPDPAHPQGVRAEVEERWNEVVQALNASPMAKRAAAIDKGPDGYWSRIIERAARSFENYILAKMQAQGFSNDYLSNVVGLSQFPRDPDRYPYLLLDEVGPIAQAFDNLFGSMQSEETETGVALYALDPPPQLRDVRGSDQARAAAAEFLNKPLVNVATGRTATVSGAALKKMLSQSGTQRSVSPQAHMMAVGNLDHLFAGAKLLRSRAPDKPGDAGVIEQLHHFEAPLPFQGKELRALMMAKEFTDASQGTRLYVVRAVTVEESEGAGVGGQAPMSGELRPGEDPGARPLPSAGESVPPDGAARDRLEDPTPGGLDMAAIRARLNSMPGAMSVQQTQAVVDRVTANWKGGFAVRVVATSADLPGRPSNARGRYVNGVGYIVANKHRTAQDVGRTLAHEVINHHGLRAMLGRDRWKQLMAQVRAAAHAGNPEVQAAQQLVRLAYRNADGSFMYEDRPELEADEIAARLIEASVDADGNMKPQLQWLKWVWAKLAEFMRSVGIDVPFTMAELHGVFVAARRNLEEDGQVLPAGMAVSPAVAAQDSQDALDEGLDARDVEIAGDTGRTYNPEQLAAMERVGFATKPEPLADRVKRLWGNAGKHLAQGIVDQFAPIKDISAQAYGLLRLSKGASGAFEVMLQGGQLKLSDGVYDFDDTKKGGVIDRLLMPLQGEHHDFLRWVAANRAEQLSAEDREHLFTPADIAALKSLADGTLAADFTLQHGPRAGQVTRSRAEAYADSLATFNEFNRNTMDMAEQSGLIDGASRALWEKAFYVPFYRVVEDGNVRGMNIKSGVVRQQAFKSLKGGDQKLNADLLENTLMNWAHLLDAAAKNRAAKATLEALAATGNAIEASDDVARQMAKSMGKPGGVVWFADGGRQRHFVVDDPYLMTAVSALEFSGMRSPIMQALGSFKHMLTIGVTVSPFFKVRNLIRDSLQAIGTAPLGANPLANVAQGWRATAPGSAEYFRLLAGGGTIHFGTMMEGSEAKRVQALVEAGVDQATILDSADKMKAFYRRMVAPVVDAYNELGNRGEAVNRAALYQQLLAQGKSHAEASLMARDLMDFSMQGSFTTVRFLTQVVPFMNARLQGLYKLGRGAAEDPARFGMVLGATALFSIGLLMAFGDDDDWKKREDWDRNNYWWFKVGGVAFRVPKPFEIGAIATLAERSWEVWFNEEMTAKRYRHNLLDLLGDNLALNPVPQLVKPIIDVYANIDGFTGRPIETMGMERLRPDFRFTERTTMAARAASTTLNAAARVVGAEAPSPVQIDHMVRGYFGWLGSMIVSSADVLARPATEQPSRPTPDYWRTLTGSMVSTLEDAPSRYVSSVYEQAKALEQTYGTWRHMLRQGQVEEAQAFREQYAPELLRYRQVEAVKRAMTQINALRRQVEGGQGTPEEKRDRLRQLQDQQDAIARRLAPA